MVSSWSASSATFISFDQVCGRLASMLLYSVSVASAYQSKRAPVGNATIGDEGTQRASTLAGRVQAAEVQLRIRRPGVPPVVDTTMRQRQKRIGVAGVPLDRGSPLITIGLSQNLIWDPLLGLSKKSRIEVIRQPADVILHGRSACRGRRRLLPSNHVAAV